MMKTVACVGVAVMLAACGTTESGFSRALEKPVKFTQAARIIAAQAEDDGIKAKLLGLAGPRLRTTAALASDTCASQPAIQSTDAALAAFGDALDVLRQVGEKPSDVSYTGYVAQFRKNAGNISTASAAGNPAAADAARREAAIAEAKARQRCTDLFLSDLAATLVPPPDTPRDADNKSLGTLLAFDAALKNALSIAERVQREAAVRATAVALLADLKAAHSELANTDLSRFGPHVSYAADAHASAIKMNQTRLGAAVSMHRWFVARQLRESAAALEKCTSACLASADQRATLDHAVAAMREYRALAALDTDAALASLDSGLKHAGDATAGKVKMSDLLDGLLTMADAISGLDQSVKDYQDAR